MELLQMRDSHNNSIITKFLTPIFCILLFPMLANGAKADCVPNQSEVPVCLSGTALAPGYSGAVIQEDGEPGLRQILPGDMVDGWTVDEIGTRYVVLKRGPRTVRLELPDTPPVNVETVEAPEPVAETPSAAAIRRGPVRHTRSLARGGE
jgi:hypothetical protein